KIAALFGPKSAEDPREKVEQFKKDFAEAARLKRNLVDLNLALAKAEDEMAKLVGKLPGSVQEVELLGTAISHLRTEIEAASASRTKLMTRNSKAAALRLVVSLPEVHDQTTVWSNNPNHTFSREIPLAISTDGSSKVAWEKFAASVKKEISDDALP